MLIYFWLCVFVSQSLIDFLAIIPQYHGFSVNQEFLNLFSYVAALCCGMAICCKWGVKIPIAPAQIQILTRTKTIRHSFNLKTNCIAFLSEYCYAAICLGWNKVYPYLSLMIFVNYHTLWFEGKQNYFNECIYNFTTNLKISYIVF